MNDESDLLQLQSIILGSYSFYGYSNTTGSNSLIMKSTDEVRN